MNKPLSIWKYYLNNRKKVSAVFVIIFLGIFLQCALLIVVTTELNFIQAALPYNSVAFACHTDGNIKQSPEYRSRLQQLLGKYPAISKALPFSFMETPMRGPLFTVAVEILSLKPEDIKPVMNCLHLTVIKGRLPTLGTHEIALHWKIAANKGLKIGSHFENEVPKSELFLLDYKELFFGNYKVVGLLDGDSIVGFCDLDTYNQDFHLSAGDTSWLIIPKKGQLAEAKSYLAQCIRKDKELRTSTGNENVLLDVNSRVTMLLNVFSLVITSIITLCISFLFYIYFYQRRSEFGLLEALGHTRQMIIGKAFLEIVVINLLGFCCGVAGALLSGWALNRFVLMKCGMPLVLWDPSYTFRLLSTPLLVTFISFLPVWRMLKKVDPIIIIEGEV
ncbi:MAG TPA: hypothetical protein DDW50_22095 [Firmicutes bacterium]|jgi:ABC-type lipoprotein release transport system permease subunit|nr:hypothetical protein [Bacillota bacterium]